LRYNLSDHPSQPLETGLGSTTVSATGAGAYHSELRYKPWGETRYSDGATPTQRHFTGQISESQLGLYFFNARWYDPYITQFTQPDSIIPDPYNPLDWDRYSFVRNNPVTYIDADGHFPILPALFLVGAFIFFSQVPSDQYQPDPANWGNAIVITVGATLMVAPAALSFFCSNDGD
jgi:RHS repeat-associated protein